MPYNSINGSSTFVANSVLTETTTSANFPTVASTGQDPRVWAREKISERTTKANKIPMFYKESLRYIISKLGTLAYLNSEDGLVDVKSIHANPERTIGKLKQDNNIILPIISINQNQSNNADGRRRGAPQIINESFWSEEKQRAVRIISEAPRH